ncbi:MAG: DNA-3-methyladenine glycosylase I [Bacteroidia bacterium]
MEKIRCNWSLGSDNMKKYHDEEWGLPVHDDLKHFEFIVLDSFQAGLSWQTILNKREGFRKAFANFNPVVVAQFTDSYAEGLMLDSSIIRNRLKIFGTIKNARAFLKIQEEFGSFDKFIWQFVDGVTINNRRESMSDVPATSPESDALSKVLKKRGFTFVGSTICYAYMQAAGMVNDHLVTCWRK